MVYKKNSASTIALKVTGKKWANKRKTKSNSGNSSSSIWHTAVEIAFMLCELPANKFQVVAFPARSKTATGCNIVFIFCTQMLEIQNGI